MGRQPGRRLAVPAPRRDHRRWPSPLEIEEHTHAGLANRYVAGASGLPFAVLRAAAGTDLTRHSPAVATVACPFTGEHLTAVAALNPDVTIVHAQRVDRHGNVQLWGISGVQKEAVLAARRAIATVEEVVDELTPMPGGVVLPRLTVDAVAVVPGGAAPSYALGYYDRDNAAYLEWEKISRDRETFTAWLRRIEKGESTKANRTCSGGNREPHGRGDDDRRRGPRAARRPGGLRRDRPPSRAANLARRLHAPGLVLVYESGTIDTRPDELPLSIGDGVLAETALSVVGVPEIFNYWLQAGRMDVGFLSGAQIDRYANLNTTVIGEYDEPDVRLPGSGGAPEISAGCREVIVVMRHRKRAFVDQVDFVTTFGHGTGPTDRALLGLHGAGPVRVITDLGVLEPDPDSRELVLTALHPGATVEQVRAETGWSLEVSDELGETTPPTERELTTLRAMRTVGARS